MVAIAYRAPYVAMKVRNLVTLLHDCQRRIVGECTPQSESGVLKDLRKIVQFLEEITVDGALYESEMNGIPMPVAIRYSLNELQLIKECGECVGYSPQFHDIVSRIEKQLLELLDHCCR